MLQFSEIRNRILRCSSCFSEHWILNTGYCLILLLCWGMTSQTMLLRCQSDSLLSVNYLLITKSSSFKRGDIVYIKDPQIKYVEANKPLAKRIVGLPGDQIQQEKQFIKVIPQDRALSPTILPLLDKTSKGEPLTPLSHTTIPEGYVFVAGDHPRSFDSRYEEFGLIRMENIRGRAIAVFSSQYPVLRFYPFQEQKNEDKE